MPTRAHRPSLGALAHPKIGIGWVAGLRLAAALLLMALAVEAAYIAFASPRLAVREITLIGDPRVCRQAAVEISLPANTNIFRAPARVLARQVEALPPVRRAYVSRQLPGRLAVTIERREAAAVIRYAQHSLLVDPGGVVFTLEDEWGWGLPELIGRHLTEADARTAAAQAEIADMLTVLRLLGTDPRLRVTRLEYDGKRDLEVTLCSGARVQLGAITELKEKAQLLAAAIDQLGGDRIEYANLSDPRAAYWRPRDGQVPSAP